MKQFMIVLAMGLALVLILSAGYFTTDEYTSSVYIEFDHRGIIEYSHRPRAEIEIVKQSYCNLAVTDAVLRRAVEDDTDPDGKKLDRIRKSSWFTGDLTGTIKRLQDTLSVTGVKDTNLIRISLSGPNPNELPEVVNAVAEALVSTLTQQSHQNRSKQMESLDTQLEETKAQIATWQETIEQICGQSDISRMRERHNVMQQTQQSLTRELTTLKLLKAQADAALAELIKKQITAMMQQQQAQVTAISERLQTVEKRHNDVSKTLRELQTSLTQIDTLETKIERSRDTADEIKKAMAKFRIAMVIPPCKIQARAEIPTKPSN